MTQVQSITDDAKQQFTLTLPNGETAVLRLWYVPLQLGWFFSLAYKKFKVASMRVTRNQNILDQFTGVLPFGLGCFTTEGQEPLLQQDFVAGNAKLCLLDDADLIALEGFYGA